MKNSTAGLGCQLPPGYDIGGDAVSPHHAAAELPIATQGEDGPSEFQPPSGMIRGDDLAVGSVTQGMTDNVLGNGKASDLEARAAGAGGFSKFPDNPSMESLNPSLVDTDESPMPAGFLGRANGWER
jgi:hypothetical protein